MSFNNLKNDEILIDNPQNKQNKIKINDILLDNPNLKFNKNLSMQNHLSCEVLSIEKFDFFIINKITYIAIPNYLCFSSNALYIFKINSYLNLEKKLSLEGHKSPIIMVKNFYDKNNDQNFLMTSDNNYLVIIWKIINEKSVIIKKTITTKYNYEIFCGLILFNPKNIFILSSNDTNVCSIEYDFISGEFKRNIYGTENNKTYYILEYNDFIIELCNDKIGFYNLLEEKDIYEINNEETKGRNNHGCIIKDLLFVSNYSYGKIIVVDLINKNIKNIINTKSNDNIYSLIQWNCNYIIISDIKNNSINIIDIKQMKIINCIKVDICPKYIKQINLNPIIYKKRKILLILGDKMFFELWSNNNYE